MMELAKGIEPPTPSLQVRSSTVELRQPGRDKTSRFAIKGYNVKRRDRLRDGQREVSRRSASSLPVRDEGR